VAVNAIKTIGAIVAGTTAFCGHGHAFSNAGRIEAGPDLAGISGGTLTVIVALTPGLAFTPIRDFHTVAFHGFTFVGVCDAVNAADRIPDIRADAGGLFGNATELIGAAQGFVGTAPFRVIARGTGCAVGTGHTTESPGVEFLAGVPLLVIADTVNALHVAGAVSA